MSSDSSSTEPVRLTQYSHGAGCGCKISPKVLETILQGSGSQTLDPNLWVGNQSKDDAAVYGIDEERGVISTTDFFMPIVDDPFDFGRIAATNAISDIFAMGGKPIMAIAILGWPVNKLSPEVAREVIRGGRFACDDAGIPLAGGHSIDSPEPIFGLAVTGIINKSEIKRNNSTKKNSKLFLTKPLGIGILTTAEKKQKLLPDDKNKARDLMVQLNKVGYHFSKLPYVNALTDVTGFGLLGHLIETVETNNFVAKVDFKKVPIIDQVLDYYIPQGCVPGGVDRNYDSYGEKVLFLPSESVEEKLMKTILCDPQTSGGLLVSVDDDKVEEFLQACESFQVGPLECIGEIVERTNEPEGIFVVVQPH